MTAGATQQRETLKRRTGQSRREASTLALAQQKGGRVFQSSMHTIHVFGANFWAGLKRSGMLQEGLRHPWELVGMQSGREMVIEKDLYIRRYPKRRGASLVE
jgi:hypothetical protein